MVSNSLQSQGDQDLEAPQQYNSGVGEEIGVLTLTRKEAAEQLKISVSMLDLLTKNGRIAVCRVGRRRLYTPRALSDYLNSTERRSRAA
jgi:excisionase family DNA binding protein